MGEHSPIEDATTSYVIYIISEKIKKKNSSVLGTNLLYQIGRETNWQMPSENSHVWRSHSVKQKLEQLNSLYKK